MKFEGEHLFPGQFGHFFVLLAFVASLLSAIAYFTASSIKNDKEKDSWISFARGAFFIQFISLVTVFGTIYYICSHHYFEYLYAYKHASKDLEPKYLLACIWEGQEGSFLLWSLWQSVLGTILIFTAKKREAPVLSIITSAQVILIVMIIGIYVGDTRIGSSPFVLTRNEIDAPIFSMANYLTFLNAKGGIGLNVLLRNYWMVIHPPVLFLGFASTIVPLSFAYSSLSTKKFDDWIKPALPWTLLSCCILGTGIMMGGKWAYESLSFGGFWAWDPVENASLVPWLILIAGLHCMAIYNSTGRALRASFFFIIFAYFFVLYSTFLTRTGILGDTSVHAFTEAGLAMNILIGVYMFFISLPMIGLFIVRYKNIPTIKKEEDISSREFWMFIGSLLFFLSALFIISITSLPVWNKIFKTNYAEPVDREFAYNKVLVLIAFIVGILTAISQYLKYAHTERKYLSKKLLLPVVIAIIVCLLIGLFYPIDYSKKGPGFLVAIYMALFASIFSVIANGTYLKNVLKGNVKAGGAAIAHFGFALMITGMLISSANKRVISDNRKTGIVLPFGKDPTGREPDDPMENLTLVRNIPTEMGPYMVTYISDSAAKQKDRVFYKIHFKKTSDLSGNKKNEDFYLNEDVYRMNGNGLSSHPGSRHYFNHDLFTYISMTSVKTSDDDTAKFAMHEMNIGDTAFFARGYMVLKNIEKNPDNGRLNFTPTDTALGAELMVYSKDSSVYKAYPALFISDNDIHFIDDTIPRENLYFRLGGIATDKKFKIGIKESDALTDFITLKAYIFPYINLVWAGLLIMIGGFIISLSRRIKAANYATLLSVLLVLSALFYMFFIANS